MSDVPCLQPGCYNRAVKVCLHCRKFGCPAHVRRYLIGDTAYADLCDDCVAEWQGRADKAASVTPADQEAPASR